MSPSSRSRYLRAISVAPHYEPIWEAFKVLCNARGMSVSKRILQLIQADLTHSGERVGPAPKKNRERVYPRRDFLERFWPKVEKSVDSCWIWKGARTGRGYGAVSVPDKDGTRRVLSAHRVSYEIVHGPISPELIVLHKCDNPACVRPDHLTLGTHVDNWRDAKAKGRWRPPGIELATPP